MFEHNKCLLLEEIAFMQHELMVSDEGVNIVQPVTLKAVL